MTNQIPGETGSSFLGGGSSQQTNQTTTWSRQSPPSAASSTADITVVAWVDKSKITLPTPQAPDLAVKLNLPGTCHLTLLDWSKGSHEYLKGPADVDYANDWLLIHSANNQPPSRIDPNQELLKGDFRLFNRFQIVSNGNIVKPTTIVHAAIPGSTPDPCGVVPNAPAETNQNNGYIGIDSASKGVAQLAEARLGKLGQKINRTINGVFQTTPWIWSVVEFDASGYPIIPFDHAMFPTYSIYWGSDLILTCPQSDPQSFIAKNESYQRLPSPIPVTSGLTSCHN